MAQQRLERQLRAGIQAAQQGNAERARELLEGVLRQERENELAWIWMASIVTTQRERRICLERVLKINPGNRPAREAINTLVGVMGSAEEIDYNRISQAARQKLDMTSGGPATGRVPTRGGGGGGNRQQRVVLLGGAAVVLGVLLLATLVLPGVLAPPRTSTPIPTATIEGEVTAEVVPLVPTNTPLIVTRAPETPLATNTPTITPTPTDTLTPTATLPPLTDYTLHMLASLGGQPAALYRIAGDGSGQQLIIDNIEIADVRPASGRLAYTRSAISPTGDGSDTTTELTQAFITPLDNPANAAQVTRLTQGAVEALSISPDGTQMVYASTQDGDSELFLVQLQTGIVQQLTNNTFADTDPDWSADGTRILFTSDRDSLGRNDIYVLNLLDSTVTQVMDTNGRALTPRWSPDGKEIVYADALGSDTNVFVGAADGTRSRQLSTRGNAQFGSPIWSPDGRYIIFVAQIAQGGDEIIFTTPTGNVELQVPLGQPFDIHQIIAR